MDEKHSTPAEPKPKPKPKKISIDDLIPEKVEVNTSLGALYVRNVHGADWEHFENNDLLELGKVAVQRLTSKEQEKRKVSMLSDEDVEALQDTDISALAPAIAKKSDWGDLPKDAGLTELGEAVKRGKAREIQRHKKRLADIQSSITSSYGFLGQTTLEKLKEQMSGLAQIREYSSASDSLKAAMASAGIEASLNTRFASEAFPPIHDFTSNKPKVAETPYKPYFVHPEETALGRATLESAENTRDTNQRMNTLVDIVAGLNHTIVMDILPGWIKKAENDQKHSEQAFIQAGNSLKWTRWAVIASVLASVIATSCQIYVSLSINQENSVSQKTTENLLMEQLAVQQKQSEQQALELDQLKQLTDKQSIEADKFQDYLDSKLTAPMPKNESAQYPTN